MTSPGMLEWHRSAANIVDRIIRTQAEAIEEAAQLSATVIAAGERVHAFGTGHSRIPVEELFPRYGSFPGFHGIVELAATTYASVSGANGLLQEMHVERMSGLAEAILISHDPAPTEALIVFSVSGANAVPLELLEGARARGLRTVAVTSRAHCEHAESDGRRTLIDAADIVIDLCVPLGDALVELSEARVGPSSTLAYVTVVNLLKVRTAELLIERGALPPVIAHASVVGATASQESVLAAVRDHARRQRGLR